MYSIHIVACARLVHRFYIHDYALLLSCVQMLVFACASTYGVCILFFLYPVSNVLARAFM